MKRRKINKRIYEGTKTSRSFKTTFWTEKLSESVELIFSSEDQQRIGYRSYPTRYQPALEALSSIDLFELFPKEWFGLIGCFIKIVSYLSHERKDASRYKITPCTAGTRDIKIQGLFSSWWGISYMVYERVWVDQSEARDSEITAACLLLIEWSPSCNWTDLKTSGALVVWRRNWEGILNLFGVERELAWILTRACHESTWFGDWSWITELLDQWPRTSRIPPVWRAFSGQGWIKRTPNRFYNLGNTAKNFGGFDQRSFLILCWKMLWGQGEQWWTKQQRTIQLLQKVHRGG